MFEKASRLKLRFHSGQGQLSVEELWELSLPALDRMAQAVNKELRNEGEESFLPSSSSKPSTQNDLRLEILKHVIAVRLKEQEARRIISENKARIARLKEWAMQKDDEKLSQKSLEEIQKEIAELEAATV